MTDIATIHEFAESLADKARALALKHFRTTTAFERKADDSPVTIADREIEGLLRDCIRARFPDHAILGEEMGHTSGSDTVWVIDPIDGTKSFLTGMPLFGCLIAVLQGGVPVSGIVEMPALGERWSSCGESTRFAKGGDAVTAKVSRCQTLEDARVYTSSPDFFHDPKDWAKYDRVSRAAAIRRFGGDCYQYGLLASGFCDLVIEASLMPYDYLALVPIVENAGGVITDWNGKPLTLESGPYVVAAATASLHGQALSGLKSEDGR